MVIYARGRKRNRYQLGLLPDLLGAGTSWPILGFTRFPSQAAVPAGPASALGLRQCLLILLLTVQQRALAKVPLTHHQQKKEKEEVEENLISSASGIAWVQSWRISRTLKEFPDLRNLPEFGICLGWAAHISRAHAAVLCFRFPPLSLRGHTLSERVNYTRKDSIPLTGCRNTKGFI